MFYAEDRATLQRIERKLDELLKWLNLEKDRDMAREDELLAKIQEETDAGVAMGMLLDKIADDLEALKATLDPTAQAKIDEAITRIQTNKDAWIAKTLENTES